MDSEKKELKLDDANRVRVLSPGMLVAKRFFRNKLAIVGLVIIAVMFLFSFVGGMISPYGESQVFYTTEEMKKDYAGATYIEDFRLIADDGVELPSDISSKMILAMSKEEYVFETRDGQMIGLGKINDNLYMIYRVTAQKNPLAMNSAEYEEAVANGTNMFEYNGVQYLVAESDGKQNLYTTEELAIACELAFTGYTSDTEFSYEFYRNVALAMGNDETTVTADGNTYTIEAGSDVSAMIYAEDGSEYAYVSAITVNEIKGNTFLSPAFRQAVEEAIDGEKESFEFAEEGEEELTYFITNKEGQYTIAKYQETTVINTYEAPSKAHWCGTDANGMDLLTRLMYGGRISLLIGFVVVIIEVLLGVIIGGIAGFFGGWIDTILMRVVDIVYCIPAMPLYLILGSIMDYYKAGSTVRIYMLCIVMSLVGWVGIARIVRGQILSLREQEFMTAAEATGISVRRRIFKHLVPNVIPQLVVFASMGIGEVILAESSLSFLGLGIKYPAASWGSIINAVNDSYVMTNYLFAWIPAGMLILLTVLAFNFIGDGLRDAFDPKMKR